MQVKWIAAALAVVVATPVVTASPAEAQRRGDRDYRWNGDRDGWDAQRAYRQGNYRERRLSRNDRIYRGRDGRYYCRRNDGTTGLVIGAIGGGVLGNVLGGGTLGTIIGAGAGGLLGREVDRGKVRCR